MRVLPINLHNTNTINPVNLAENNRYVSPMFTGKDEFVKTANTQRGTIDDIKTNIDVLYSEPVIQKQIQRVASEINKYYGDKEELVLVGVLKGASKFHLELSRYLDMPVKWEFITASSYRGDESTGDVKLKSDDIDVDGKNVLIVEDIVDTGTTMKKIYADFTDNKNAKSLKLATLADKQGVRPKDFIVPDFNALIVQKGQFVVGYGLDYKGYYRNLPYIGILKNPDKD